MIRNFRATRLARYGALSCRSLRSVSSESIKVQGATNHIITAINNERKRHEIESTVPLPQFPELLTKFQQKTGFTVENLHKYLRLPESTFSVVDYKLMLLSRDIDKDKKMFIAFDIDELARGKEGNLLEDSGDDYDGVYLEEPALDDYGTLMNFNVILHDYTLKKAVGIHFLFQIGSYPHITKIAHYNDIDLSLSLTMQNKYRKSLMYILDDFQELDCLIADELVDQIDLKFRLDEYVDKELCQMLVNHCLLFDEYLYHEWLDNLQVFFNK
ncbi:BA75_04560T0 [Komagataella pastoris]|uniref:BA75_04560T0 n=1 Tax=Komagataella pastoris TaxID=4922 RepID=A0A1B2JHQ2_PICPA|nr:BA75_04560T0 [Komagataella pastoris]